MGFVILILIVFVLTLTLLKVILKPGRLYKLPPGPRGLPLLGNIPQIIVNPHLKLSEWVRIFGPMFTIKFGMRKALVVSDAKLMKDIFSLPASTGKYKTDTFLVPTRGPHGVLSTEGQTWSEQRQFCIRSLVKHGFGSKTSLEPMIVTEVDEVSEWIKSEMERNGKVSLLEIFRIATNNTLLSIVTGERVSLENRKVSKLLENLMQAMQFSVTSGLNFLPILKYVAPSASGYNALDKAGREIHEFIGGLIEEHKKTFVPGVERDVIDSYLEHRRTVTDPTSSFSGKVGEKNMVSSISEVFMAGGETTPITLEWLMLYVCHHQDVQMKLHKEIDNIIGKYRDPSLMDKPRMPYTEAVILETLRMSSLMPMGIIHELLEDIEFCGYTLPKGMLLIPNMYHVHHDQEIWGDPEEFRPERFLNVNESELVSKDNIVAFQPGRRACLGEPLAKDVLFLFVTKLFQAFCVCPDPSSPKPDFTPDVGIGLVAKPFKVVMKQRS